MQRALRLQLKEIDEGLVESGDRERLLRLLARIQPDDARNLRRLAVEFMRQNRFAEAGEIWSRIVSLNPADEIARKNRGRCATLAERRSSVIGTELTDVG
jgi:cytochrome c-type biogenesis protein CcmH/NrfG